AQGGNGSQKQRAAGLSQRPHRRAVHRSTWRGSAAFAGGNPRAGGGGAGIQHGRRQDDGRSHQNDSGRRAEVYAGGNDGSVEPHTEQVENDRRASRGSALLRGEVRYSGLGLEGEYPQLARGGAIQ